MGRIPSSIIFELQGNEEATISCSKQATIAYLSVQPQSPINSVHRLSITFSETSIAFTTEVCGYTTLTMPSGLRLPDTFRIGITGDPSESFQMYIQGTGTFNRLESAPPQTNDTAKPLPLKSRMQLLMERDP